MSACPPVDQCKLAMERLRKKSQQGIDKLLNFAQLDPQPDLPCPTNVPIEEGKIDGYLGEMELQWRHHGLLMRQLLDGPLEKISEDSIHAQRLKDALQEAKKDSLVLANVLKSLTKDKNRAVMKALDAYDLWQGGKGDQEKESGAGAIWEKTFELQDEAAGALDDILDMAESQNEQGADALVTMKEQSELYKANIEDANTVAEGFREGLARLTKLSATASRDPLGCGLCVLATIVVFACVKVSI
eukprot:TRINITY_DN2985_c0_g1_i5.p1 TRINITY_DN2985_c0_g1~~TRINITY_DN2985_c0_g1_i5.p1  ORF type:complete len:244 (-),score=61.23 TRINITY_DN2985_c0_g1_i5:100-831(-)